MMRSIFLSLLVLFSTANEEFRQLYSITDLRQYSQVKAEIFTRYRTLSEALGILLVNEAKRKGMNIMIETSGRDIAMFKYIDHLFPNHTNDSNYRKLAINFKINDLSYAERSVDSRMLKEMSDGQVALKTFQDSSNGHESERVREIINANAGR